MTDPRRAAPRHAVHRGRSGWGAALKALAITTAVVVASTASVAAIGVWSLGRTVAANAVDITNGGAAPTIAAMDGSFNVLLVGADNAPGQKTWGASRDATLNDVNILVHIAADHKSGVVVSLPRDLVIAHPQCEDPTTHEVYSAMAAQPLNTAYARGGLGCVVATVENLTGIKVPYAALFSFEGTVKMADAVGGVPICVTKAIDDPDSGLKLPAGRSVISGRTALAYLRSRHGVGDQSDLSRIGSQQAYMSSLLRTMMSRDTFTNPGKLYGLAQAAAQNVRLSQSLASVDTIVTMALALKGMNLQHLVFVQYPTGADPENPNKVVPDTELADALLRRVRADLPVALDKSSLGLSTELAPSAKGTAPASTTKKSSTPEPTPTKSSSAVLDGLRGQTAAQQTCSIAASH
ncbi:MAG: LCP family protein [Amnibacterium sp.]